jgi:membrane protease YdiL (CAAX protease family)
MINQSTPSKKSPSTALLRCLILILSSIVVAIVISPFIYKTCQTFSMLEEYPFRRVFNRVAEILIIFVFVAGWKWTGVQFQFRPLLARNKAAGRYFTWLIVGCFSVVLLIVMQVYGGLRVYREREFAYLLGKFLSAVVSAVTVGFFEEFVFRGYVLQAFSQHVSRYKAMLYASMVFAVIHVFSLDHFIKPIRAIPLDGTDLLAGWKLAGLFLVPLGEPLVVIPGIIGLFLAGWLLAELTLRQGSLFPAIGLHTGWVFGIHFLGRIWKYKPTEDAGPLWFYGEKFAATGVLGWLMIGVLIVVVYWKIK